MGEVVIFTLKCVVWDFDGVFMRKCILLYMLVFLMFEFVCCSNLVERKDLDDIAKYLQSTNIGHSLECEHACC